MLRGGLHIVKFVTMYARTPAACSPTYGIGRVEINEPDSDGKCCYSGTPTLNHATALYATCGAKAADRNKVYLFGGERQAISAPINLKRSRLGVAVGVQRSGS